MLKRRSITLFSAPAAFTISLLMGACAAPQNPPEPAVMTIPESQGLFEAAIELLQKESHNPDPAIRANCMEALQIYSDRRTTTVLEEGLHDPAWVVRFAAALAAGKQKNTDLQPEIATLVATDPDLSVRVAMIYALKEMGDSTNMNFLATALKSPKDPTLRANTAMVLGMLGDPSAIPLLDTARRDPDPRVRLEVTSALALLGDPEAQDTILAMSLNLYAEERYTAIATAAELKRNTEVRNVLIQGVQMRDQIKDPTPEEHLILERAALIAARGLAKRGDADAPKLVGQLVVKLSGDPNPMIRSLAALALGDLLYPSEEANLARLIHDPDVHVRVAAAAAIVNVQMREVATVRKL